MSIDPKPKTLLYVQEAGPGPRSSKDGYAASGTLPTPTKHHAAANGAPPAVYSQVRDNNVFFNIEQKIAQS